MKYNIIRKEYQAKLGLDSILADFYACMFSPFFTQFFLKNKWKPNSVTIGMIVSGLIGGLLFLVPSVPVRIMAIVFIHLWYILDCSDGEVARITSTFSKYGKELDYMAHTINHPLFIIAFIIAYYQNNILDIYTMICFILLIAGDSLIRLFYTFGYIENIREGASAVKQENNISLRRILLFAINFFVQLPNFNMIFPIILLLNMNISKLYLFFSTFIMVLYAAYTAVKWIKKIHYK